MGLDNQQKDYIKEVIINCLRAKFQHYKPESNNMPFHYRLLGKDRMALYSFIQSLNTTFGTSIFEPVAVALAQSNFKKVEKQYVIGNQISSECQNVIQYLMNNLTLGKTPNKKQEIELIWAAASKGNINRMNTVKVDLYLETHDGEMYFFDLKTAKPNISNFKDFKRTLLEWVGIALTRNPNAKINSLIAIPHNPYEPRPMKDGQLKVCLMIGKNYWWERNFGIF